MSSRLLTILALSLCPNAAIAAEQGTCLPTDVARLLANKGSYEGKQVCVSGYVKIQFEGNEMYHGESAVWLDFYGQELSEAASDRIDKQLAKWKQLYQYKCVVVVGRFSTKLTGHFGMWPGGIDQIESIGKGSDCPVNK